MNKESVSIYFYFLQFLTLLFVVFPVRSSLSLAKCIPKYFILFDAVIDGVIFSISFLNCSLLLTEILLTLVYWSCTAFAELIY